MFSPRTMEHYTLNPSGAVYGYALQKGPPGIGSRTPFENLLLVGAWAAGGGQTTVMKSGLLAARHILSED